jgi:hypothetical protein
MLGSVTAGIPEKKASKAASPPAEAPMPTMGNGFIGSTFEWVISFAEAVIPPDRLGGNNRNDLVEDVVVFFF